MSSQDEKVDMITKQLLPLIPNSLRKSTVQELAKMRKTILERFLGKLTHALSTPIDLKHRKIRVSANMLYSIYKCWQNQNPNTKPHNIAGKQVFIRVSGNTILACLGHSKWIYEMLAENGESSK